MAGHVKSDIALYESVDLSDAREAKRYFVMFKYAALEPKDPAKPDGEKVRKIYRQNRFEVFNSLNPFPANGVQIQGLTTGTAVRDQLSMGYRFISGSSGEKGVLAVFQNKQAAGDNQRDHAANCVGPVLWWGIADRDSALKACRDDRL